MTEYIPGLNVYRHHCPLGTCTWHYDEDVNAIPVRMILNPRTGDMYADPTIAEERARQLNLVARSHLESHGFGEWAAEVNALRMRVAELEVQARRRDTADGIRPHAFPPAEAAEIERLMRRTPPIHITGLDG